MTVTVDKERCVGCGACVSICPAGVFEIVDGKAEVKNPDACVMCKNCENSCPAGAIKVE